MTLYYIIEVTTKFSSVGNYVHKQSQEHNNISMS